MCPKKTERLVPTRLFFREIRQSARVCEPVCDAEVNAVIYGVLAAVAVIAVWKPSDVGMMQTKLAACFRVKL